MNNTKPSSIQEQIYSPSIDFSSKCHIQTLDKYQELYERSIKDPQGFWGDLGRSSLSWFSPFTRVMSGTLLHGDVAWFLNGKLNVSYNCIDRHLEDKADKVAIIYEGDDPKNIARITYYELYQQVCRLANLLKSIGVKKGDTVAIYLPNTPVAIYAMLACARIGAVHSVIFAGFGFDSIVSRVKDAECRVIITADEGLRGGKVIPLKKKIDEVALHCNHIVKNVLVFKNTSGKVNFNPEIDIWADEAMLEQRPYCPPETLDSEDPLFILYTSGSTGTPKGLVHTQAGYLLYAATTHKYVFDYQPNDIYACVADVGWITGHSYIVYGPLCNGATTFIFEGTPLYPTPARYWEMVERHKINQFYTAPTAIRSLMKYPTSYVEASNKTSLRVLGSVGEPINPEAWRWFYKHVGEERCSVVDTYWQTESGGHLITPLPGATPNKPGSCSKPFFGIELSVLDAKTGQAISTPIAEGVLAISKPWPGIARTVFKSHTRFLTTYMKPYPGFYFTGDGVRRDKDGYYWIEGRVDDVINVAGHRLGTAELESALVGNYSCAEAAVVGFPHDVKGQGILAFCILKEGYEEDEQTKTLLIQEVRNTIGPFATPDVIIITPSLPKTRSGKIMRRILRKIACHESSPEQLGDTSTLAEPEIIPILISKVSAVIPKTG
uniref:Acetyl-coenzyme A synthetase n=1 Tax=Coremiostelium polycephalum TaxID=142831 RepID=A0A1L2FUY8_9MYCE|nr:acetyl-CoA synthetase/acetyl-CoA ligase [Coremiostelium polycephalum]|eukprot:gene638-791_t